MLTLSVDDAAKCKLKDYLQDCINKVSDEYITALQEGDVCKADLIQEHRNMLLCIKAICKARNKF